MITQQRETERSQKSALEGNAIEIAPSLAAAMVDPRCNSEPSALILRGLTILLVDDDPMCRRLLTEILEAEKYQVITTSSAEAALIEYGRATRIDLLISEASLPGINGIALGQILTREQPLLRVLIVSGDVKSSDLPRAWFHREKPINVKRFRELVAQIIGKRPVRSDARTGPDEKSGSLA